MSALNHTPSPRGTHAPWRLFAALGFAVVAFGAIVGTCAALGYGHDVHARRVLALTVFLLSGGILACWVALGCKIRVAFVMFGIVGAAASWLLLPCRTGGMSLVAAIRHRELLEHWLSQPVVDHLDQAADLKTSVESFAEDFPSLASPLKDELRGWSKIAANHLLERFSDLGAGDITQAHILQVELDTLHRVFPEAAVESISNSWVDQALKACLTELAKVSAGDASEFNRTSDSRRALSVAFPSTLAKLIAMETQWAESSVSFQLVAYTHADISPREIRAGCLSISDALLSLKSLETSPGRFLSTRHALFNTAHAAAQVEVRRHIEGGRPDIAQTVATQHGLAWFATAKLLGPMEEQSLTTLRESCRYLAVLSAKAGGLPEEAPLPRTREIAPEPRQKP